MKNGILFCFIVLLISCNQNTKELHGTYQSYRRNLVEQLLLKINNAWYSVGETMELNPDSTFTYTTCGIIQKGRWAMSKDTLILNIESYRWRNDSLHQFGRNGKQPIIPETPTKYIIKGNRIIIKDTIILRGKETLLLSNLKKS